VDFHPFLSFLESSFLEELVRPWFPCQQWGRAEGGVTSEVMMDGDEEPWCSIVVADAGDREDVPISMVSAVTLPVRQV